MVPNRDAVKDSCHGSSAYHTQQSFIQYFISWFIERAVAECYEFPYIANQGESAGNYAERNSKVHILPVGAARSKVHHCFLKLGGLH